MNLRHSTVLITGGTNGIGWEFGKQFLQEGATVIVTGRNTEKLEQTRKQLPGIHAFHCDLNIPQDIEKVSRQIIAQFPDLNIIVNNAGIMTSVGLTDESINIDNVADEIETNFSGTVRMVHAFLPHLLQKTSAAIVNVTSGLAFIPFTISPIYCGTKAGIHVYSQGLRLKLKDTGVKVFEVAPPKTNKPLQTAIPESSSPSDMKVDKMVKIAIHGILKDKLEIRPGLSNVMKWMSRIAPDFFTKLINKNIEKARAKALTKVS
ncbi:SDR family NAD(P)-dependent oxidoreductase [Mucilaginibacter sp. SMC90]|uniref:SDR family oxidoreductase n=1 Tax=Mucilaginibacter sp. SMC90 TaxID=2929803 RepID=UPI001FB52D42|nr:SDR family NAD(P)-dependent oxidoreductase [Mucilaginibacter sp. SMC90]UOE51369.1 SDR family NAD(P)-dependent oxidoreductase [Mucilaginibacter sp. SMC90]